MALQLRRGTDAERLEIIPELGEPIFCTDTKDLWIGDGVTIGGIKLTGDVYGAGAEINNYYENFSERVIDSEWFLRQIGHFADSDWIVKQIKLRSADSEWVKESIEHLVDSEWVQRKIKQLDVDSDWILRNIPSKITTTNNYYRAVVGADSEWVSRRLDSEYHARREADSELRILINTSTTTLAGQTITLNTTYVNEVATADTVVDAALVAARADNTPRQIVFAPGLFPVTAAIASVENLSFLGSRGDNFIPGTVISASSSLSGTTTKNVKIENIRFQQLFTLFSTDGRNSVKNCSFDSGLQIYNSLTNGSVIEDCFFSGGNLQISITTQPTTWLFKNVDFGATTNVTFPSGYADTTHIVFEDCKNVPSLTQQFITFRGINTDRTGKVRISGNEYFHGNKRVSSFVDSDWIGRTYIPGQLKNSRGIVAAQFTQTAGTDASATYSYEDVRQGLTTTATITTDTFLAGSGINVQAQGRHSKAAAATAESVTITFARPVFVNTLTINGNTNLGTFFGTVGADFSYSSGAGGNLNLGNLTATTAAQRLTWTNPRPNDLVTVILISGSAASAATAGINGITFNTEAALATVNAEPMQFVSLANAYTLKRYEPHPQLWALTTEDLKLWKARDSEWFEVTGGSGGGGASGSVDSDWVATQILPFQPITYAANANRVTKTTTLIKQFSVDTLTNLQFYEPTAGVMARVEDTNFYYIGNGTAWVLINTTYDYGANTLAELQAIHPATGVTAGATAYVKSTNLKYVAGAGVWNPSSSNYTFIKLDYNPTTDQAIGAGTLDMGVQLSNYPDIEVTLNGVEVDGYSTAGSVVTFNFFIRGGIDEVRVKLRG